jgi:non-ribosomal peptide synthase protein (TIGR01720 family)
VRPYHSQIQELLLTALLHTLSIWIQGHGQDHQQQIRLDLEGHGREDIGNDGALDITRTVGWFTSLFPVLFTLPSCREDDWQTWIMLVKEQLRAVPHKGFGYGLLRYLQPDDEHVRILRSAQPAPISFNYLGQFDQVVQVSSHEADTERVQIAPEASGATSGPLNVRNHPLEIDGLLLDGQLQLTWSYSTRHFHDDTINRLAQQVQDDLQQIVTHCLSPQAGKWTPADFPLARLDQVGLDRVLGKQADAIEDLYPLTSLQQGLLFHSLAAPRSGVYVEQFWCVVNQLDQARFMQAWEAVIAQHPVLRTSFVWDGLEQPLQLVWRRASLPLRTEDWRTMTSEQQHYTFADYVHADREQGFDLQQVPLQRLALIRLDDRRTQVLWTYHHILMDGWSMTMLVQELFSGYLRLIQNSTVTGEPRRPYRDYLHWLLD